TPKRSADHRRYAGGEHLATPSLPNWRGSLQDFIRTQMVERALDDPGGPAALSGPKRTTARMRQRLAAHAGAQKKNKCRPTTSCRNTNIGLLGSRKIRFFLQRRCRQGVGLAYAPRRSRRLTSAPRPPPRTAVGVVAGAGVRSQFLCLLRPVGLR